MITGAVNELEYETFVRESTALYEKEKSKLLHEALDISPVVIAPPVVAEAKGATSPMPHNGSKSATPAPASAIKAGDGEESQIRMVMEQADVTRDKAIEALRANKNNAINAIMDLMQ